MTRIERMRALVRRLGALKRQPATRRQIVLAGTGVVAALLALGAALPAGAKTKVVVSVVGGASVTIKPTVTFKAGGTIKAGPVTFTGGAPVRAPRVASNVGHFIVGQPTVPTVNWATGGTAPRPIYLGGIAYSCVPYGYGAPVYGGAGYGGAGYGGAGYGVPLYDYRAQRAARPRIAYGYGVAPYRAAQRRAPAVETPGTFNLPQGYVEVGLTETARPSFEPLIVQIAGAPAQSGPLPVVHKPAGKNHIHIE
jgi:hypothetical protein